MLRLVRTGARFTLSVTLLLSGGLLFAAPFTSQFPNDSSTTVNWVATSGSPGSGDRDATVVVFFEIPDSTTASTIYFAVNDPANLGGGYDLAGSGTSYWYLIGGPGALTDPSSQQILFTPYPSTQPLSGTVLKSFQCPSVTSTTWYYFGGVRPNQGEHIGNKYYFKIVLQVDPNVGKNAFQLDVQTSTPATPSTTFDVKDSTGTVTARSFAFGWSPILGTDTSNSAGAAFDFYPFVPANASGSVSSNTWDVDNGITTNNFYGSSTTTNPLGSINIGANSALGTSNYNLLANPYTNTFWHLYLVGANNTSGVTDDVAEVWFNNGTTNLRTYSSAFTVVSPDHAALTYGSGSIPVNGTGRVAVQIVDSGGNPVLIGENVRVVVSGSGSPQITAASNTSTTLPASSVLVTTDGNGLGYVDVTDSSADTVTVTAYTDGSNGSSLLGAGTVTTLNPSLTFTATPPAIALSSSPTFVAASSSTLLGATVTVTAGADNQLTSANGIEIRIPVSLNLTFDTTAAPTYGGTGSGNINGGQSGFLSSRTFFIALSSSLTGGQTITLSGLKVVIPLATPSSGQLQLSTDGGGSFSVASAQTITINIPSTGYSWTGGAGDGLWSSAANWSPAGPPPSNSAVTIGASQGTITVDTTPSTLASLSIGGSGTTLDPNGNTLAVVGATTLNGTITGSSGVLSFGGTLSGGGTLNASSTYTYFGGNLSVTTFNANGGTAIFNGSANQTISNAYTFQNLSIQDGAASTVTASGNVTVNSTLYIASGSTYDTGGRNLSVTGSTSNAGTLRLQGGETTISLGLFSTAAGTVTYYGTGSYGSLKAGNSYYNLSFVGTGTWTLGAALTATNNLTLAAGTLDTRNGSNYQVNVGGNWNRSGGTFTPRLGTVVFTTAGTASQILGSTTFYSFSSTAAGKTLQFQAGQTQTIGGTLTLTGATGSAIQLQSTSPGTQWTFSIGANQNVTAVSVQDGNVTSGSAVAINATSSYNVGNNNTVGPNGYWNFVSPPAGFTWTGGGLSTSWTSPANWGLGSGYPGYGDSVTIPTVGNGWYPVLATTRTISSLSISGSGRLTTNGYNLIVSATTQTPGGLTLSGGGSLIATGSETIRVDGNIDLSGGTYTTASSTLIVSGGVVGSSFTLKTATNLQNLTVNLGSAQTVALNSAVTTGAAGTFTLGSGAVNLNGFGLSVLGAASLASNIQNTGIGAGFSVSGTTTLSGTTQISSNGAPVTLSGTVSSPGNAYSLNVTKGVATATFGGAVGASGNPLSSLTTDAGGTVALNGGSVTTTGSQTYNGPVTLGAGTTLSTTAGGSISMLGTVNGLVSLSIASSGGGSITLGGTVGGTSAPTTLTVNSAGTAGIAAVTTSAAQSYTAATSTTLNGTLTVNAAGAGVSFTGAVLLAAGGGTMTLTGTNAANSVSFSATSTVNGAQPLSITAGGGTITFAAAVGGSNALGAISLTSNTMTFSAGPNTIHGTSTLLLQSSSAATTIGVAGAAGTLQVTDTDVKALAPGFTQIQIGRADGTVAVSVNTETFTSPVLLQSGGAGGTVVLNGTLSTSTSGSGAITVASNATLATGAIAVTGAGGAADSITFNGTVNGAQTLSVTAGSGPITFSNTVGNSSAPTSLTVVSSSTTSLKAVTTSAAQSYTAATSTTLNGTLTVNTAGAGVAFTGPVLLGVGGGTIALTGSNAGNVVSFSGTSTVNGGQPLSITAGALGSVNFAAGAVVGGVVPLTSVTVVSSDTTSLRAVTTSAAQSYTAATSTTLNGTLRVNAAGAGVAFTGPVLLGVGGGTITLTGSNAGNVVSFSGTSTVNGGQPLSITAGALGSVNFAVGAVVGGTTPVGSFTLVSGALTSNANNISTTGALDTSGGSWNVGSGGTVTAGANVTFGTVTNGSGSILTMNGGVAQVLVPNGQTLGTLHVKVSLTAVTMTGTATFDGIAVDTGASLTFGSTGAASVTVAGGSTDATLTGAGADILTAGPAGQLSLSGASGIVTLTMAAGTSITNSGVLQVTSSTNAVTMTSSGAGTTLNAGSNALGLGGHALSLGYFTTSVAHTLGANDQVSLVGPATFSGGLTLNGASSSVTTGSNTLTATGGLTITVGTVDVTGSGSVNAGASAVSVGASGVLVLNTTAATALQSGDFTSAGTVTNSAANTVAVSGSVLISGTFSTPSSSTISMSGSGKTINAAVQIGSLGVQNGASVSVSTNPLSLAGSLTVTSTGTFGTAGNSLTVAGSIGGSGALTASASESISETTGWSISSFTPATSSVTFGGGSVAASAYNFNDVTVSGSVTLSSSLGVLDNLTINAVTGALSAGTYAVTVGGSWTNNRGAAGFTSSAAVTFNDASRTSTITGATTFYDFICATNLKKINFTPAVGNASTISHNLTVTGTSGGSGLITLESQTPGSQWYLSVGNAASVTYAVVSDSNNTGALITADHSKDAGNNTNWAFSGWTVTWVGTNSASWNLGGNWSDGYVPNPTDSAVINNGTPNNLDVQGLSSATTSITGLTINGTLNATAAGSVNVLGSITVAGTAVFGNPANTTWVMTGAGTSINSFLGSSVGNITVNPGALNTITLTNPLTITSLAITSGTLDLNGRALTLASNLTLAAGTIAVGTGTLDAQTNAASITINAGGTITQGAAGAVKSTGFTVSGGTYTSTAAGSLSANGPGISVTSGTLTVNADAVTTTAFTQSGGAATFTTGTMSSSGSVGITAGTFTPGSSTVTMTGAATTVEVTGAGNQLNNLTVNSGGTVSLTGNPLTVGGSLQVSGGTFGLGGNDLGVTGGTTVNFGSTMTLGGGNLATGALTVPGALTASASETISASGNVSLTGTFTPVTSVITLSGGNTTLTAPAGGLTVSGLTINKTAAANTATLGGGNLTVSGLLSMTQGTLVIAGRTLTLGQDLTMGNANGTIQVDTGTLDAQTNGRSITANAGTINQTTGTIRATGLSVSGGTVSSSGSGVLSVNGTGITVSSGTLSVNADAVTTTAFTQSGGNATFTTGTMGASGNLGITAGTFTPGSSTVTMTGAATTVEVTGAGNELNNLTIGAAGAVTTAGNVTLAGKLTVSAPATFVIGAGTPVVVTVNSATGANDVLVNGALQFTGAAAASTLSVADLGQINNAAVGGITVTSSANTVSMSSPGTATLIGNQIAVNGQQLTLSGISTTVAHSLGANDRLIIGANPVSLNGGLTLNGNASTRVSVGANTLNATGGMTVTAGTVSVAGPSGTINAATSPVLVNGGTLSFDTAASASVTCGDLTVSAGSIANNFANTITTSGNVAASVPSGNFTNPTNSTIVMTASPGRTINATTTLGNLTIDPGAGVTDSMSTNALTIAGTLTLTSGTFDASAANLALTIGGSFINNVGTGGFNSRTGTVTFNGSGTIQVLGNTIFNGFYCDIPGLTIQFGAGATTEIKSTGTFHVHGTSGSHISLTSDSGASQWNFRLDAGAILDMIWVDVDWSNAVIPVPVPLNVTITVNCTGWYLFNPVTSSYTEDTDHDGKIDSILVFCTLNINNLFNGFSVAVSGYTVSGQCTPGPYPDSFYIPLAEKSYLDTATVLTWHIVTNTSLFDSAIGNKQVVVNSAGPLDTPATTGDDAEPVIAYTLAVAGKSQVYLHFSEPVYRSAGTPLVAGDFTVAGVAPTSIQAITTDGAGGVVDLLLNTASVITATQVAQQSLVAVTAAVDNPAVAPSPFTSTPDQVAEVPSSAGVPNPHPLVSLTHRVTDVGLGLPGLGLVEPVYAWDETVRDPARGGIGLITSFDGSAFLQPQAITIQANVNPVVSSQIANPLIAFDSGVGSGYLSNGLWMPDFLNAESKFSGLVPYPDPGVNTLGVAASPGGQLRNYLIPGSNSKIQDGQQLEFFFEDNATDPTNPLYYGRITDPSSLTWYRNIRPWSIEIRHLISQRGDVTILNNVINPDRGQKTSLYYTLPKDSTVTIMVFDLSGDVITVLSRGPQRAGDHSTTWDGKNAQGRAVARGIYFIRLIASGIDEYRKVLVVR